MVFITGDTHGDFRRFERENFPEQDELTKDDYVVIMGDFGAVLDSAYRNGNYKEILEPDFDWAKEPLETRLKLNVLEKKSYTTLFVSGNHENHDRLATYPDKKWHGGVVKELRPSVLLLKRGYVFDIDGNKCFTFGGAQSHDIKGGILEVDDPLLKQKLAYAKKNKFHYGINHISWWKEELPSIEEMNRGLDTLNKNNWEVDYVFTHEAPASDVILMQRGFMPDDFSGYLEKIKQKLTYKNWVFGHYHTDSYISDKDICLYRQITSLPRQITKENSAFNYAEEERE